MGNMAEVQHKNFHARIKRIHKGGPNTMGHILVGSQDDSHGKTVKPIKVRKGETFGQRLGTAFADILLMPFSFALGAAAMVLGLTLVFHLQAAEVLPVAETGFAAYTDVFIAVLLAIAVGGILRLSRGPRKLAIFIGLAAVYVLQDSLIQTYPDIAAELMSEDMVVRSALSSLASI